jgi:UDP-2,3-diacylglucosamine hydrolase
LSYGYFFASDFHLGSPNPIESKAREQRIVQWLDSIAPQAKRIFLVGDVFDFWFEYQTVIPKGFLHLFAKLTQLRQAGIEIDLFVGNHDLWLGSYLQEELGIRIHHQSLQVELEGKHFFIAHGDGLGPKDYGYKRLKRIFTNPLCRWLFRWIHPDIGTGLATSLSRRSRAAQPSTEHFLGKDKEWLLAYSERKLQQLPQVDYFVFGHRHLPLDILLSNGQSRYLNLGEWLHSQSYAQFNGQNLELCFFQKSASAPYQYDVRNL